MAALLQHQQQNHNNKSEPGGGGGEGLGLLPSRSCDTCHAAAAAATLYCHHHAAFFCAACDCAVAGSRHERVLMCEVCLQAPAVLSCKADAAALCASCDADVHSANPLAYRHERLPVVPFVGPVDLTRAKHAGDAWRIQNTGPGVDLMADFLCSDSDLFEFGFSGCNYQIYNLEKLTDVNGSFENHHHHHRSFAFADSYVPTKSNGNSSSDIVSNRTIENCFDHHIDKLNSNEQHMISFNNYSALLSASSSETGVVPDGNGNSSSEVSYTFTKPSTVAGGGDVADGGLAGAPTRAADREARVLRYREKRKNRKFQKTIRYASRKAYAETRPRVKGRFAKRTSPNGTSDSDRIYRFGSGPANGFVIDHGGYGVVPSFR